MADLMMSDLMIRDLTEKQDLRYCFGVKLKEIKDYKTRNQAYCFYFCRLNNPPLNRIDLEKRTRQFHIDVIHLCSLLPRNAAAYELAKQLIRSAGSVGANYKATKRAKSSTDFIYKIEVVLEEADESHYWLTIIRDANMIDIELLHQLIKEANELTAIFAATDKTAKNNRTILSNKTSKE